MGWGLKIVILELHRQSVTKSMFIHLLKKKKIECRFVD